MIIYDNLSDEKLCIELSELGICTDFVCSLEFKQYEKDSNAFALYFEFINYDKVKRFVDDSIALHILSSGFSHSYNQFDIGISFVYYFNTDTTKINVDITSFDETEENGIHLVSNKENIDTSTPTGKLMLTFLAGIAEFERENLLERQREGIAIAKENGKYKGRKPFKSDKFETLYQEYIKRKITKAEFALQIGTSRPTLNKLIKNYEKSSHSEEVSK